MASNNESKYDADGSVSDLSGLNTRYHRFLDNIGKFTFKNLDLFVFLLNNFTERKEQNISYKTYTFLCIVVQCDNVIGLYLNRFLFFFFKVKRKYLNLFLFLPVLLIYMILLHFCVYRRSSQCFPRAKQ